MQLADHDFRTALIHWAHNCRQIVLERAPAAESQIQQAIAQFENTQFSLAVLGKVKRGKSTLINALLGRTDDAIAPVDKLPASSAISRFRWAERESATVVFRDGRSEAIPYARIREFVTEDGNPANRREVSVVEVAGPFAELGRNVELIDTPGAGSIHEHHDALLHAFIPQADAVIFLVTARMPLDQDELDLLRKLQEADIRKIFFAINRVDESSLQDIEAAIAHNRAALSKLGISVSQIYKISAKRAFTGDLPGSQLETLAADLRQFLTQCKGKLLAERFVSRVRQACVPVHQALAVEVSSSTKSATELAADLQQLTAEKRRVEHLRKPAEDEFEREWQRALNDFERSLHDVEQIVRLKVSSQISGVGLFDVSSLAKELPTILQRAVEAELQEPSRRLESRLQAATEKLQVDSPNPDLGFLGIQRVRVTEGDLALKGIAGGVTAVAVGGSLMVAGQAAAASILAVNAAAITTVTAPSVISTVGAALIPEAAGLFSFLGTGTATMSVPSAMVTTPLWVAMAGPIGWTLIGLGVAAVPFAWRASKLKTRDKLEEAAQEQVATIFQRLRTIRVPQLREMADEVRDEFQSSTNRQLAQLEVALTELQHKRPDDRRLAQLTRWQHELDALLTAASPA